MLEGKCGYEGGVNPYSLKEYKPNAFDLCGPLPHGGGREYEEHCFRSLAEVFPDDLLLGPNIINTTLEHPYTTTIGKPDMVGLRTSGSRWHISTFYECKNTRNLHVKGKLEKFKRLLDKLRCRPDHLPQQLQRFGDGELEMLTRITIPSPHDITVVFLSPQQYYGDFYPAHGFPVTYKTIPYQPEM